MFKYILTFFTIVLFIFYQINAVLVSRRDLKQNKNVKQTFEWCNHFIQIFLNTFFYLRFCKSLTLSVTRIPSFSNKISCICMQTRFFGHCVFCVFGLKPNLFCVLHDIVNVCQVMGLKSQKETHKPQCSYSDLQDPALQSRWKTDLDSVNISLDSFGI